MRGIQIGLSFLGASRPSSSSSSHCALYQEPTGFEIFRQPGIFFIHWKPLIMITLGPALFDNNNRLITLSGGYKHLHYLTQFIVTNLYAYKNKNIYLKTYIVCSALRPPCPFAVEFSLSSLL